MNAKTRLSAKGQVVIPKDVRDHLGLKPGQTLDVIETAGGVLLRPAKAINTKDIDQVLDGIRERLRPYIKRSMTIEEIDSAAEQAWANTRTVRTLDRD